LYYREFTCSKQHNICDWCTPTRG